MLNPVFLMYRVLLMAVYGLFCLKNGLLLPIMVYSERQTSHGLSVSLNMCVSLLFFALVEIIKVAFENLLYTHQHLVSFHVE